MTFIINGNELSLSFNNKEIKLTSYKNEKHLLTYVDNLFKKPIIVAVKIPGQELQHHTSLFGIDENLTIIADPETGEIEFERLGTGYKDTTKAEIVGKYVKRTIDPRFIFPYIASLKEKDSILINFYDPYLIEIKTTNDDKISYLLMPILNKN